MRVVVRVVVFLLALVVVAAPGSVAFGAAGPVVVHPNWRVVAPNEPSSVVANDRYVGILHGYTGRVQLTLIDEQTGAEEMLSPPSCWQLSAPLLLGGPWLMVGCGNPDTPDLTYMLYNIASGQWTPFTISSQCSGPCSVVAIGSYWVKILSPPAMYHLPPVAYLQNIQTGSLISDPVSPGGQIYDDLSAPAGPTRLCAPLSYPTVYTPAGAQPGSVAFYGDFALLVGQHLVGTGPNAVPGPRVASLQRCNSGLNMTIPFPSDIDLMNSGEPFASSAAVMVTVDGKALDGWLLPSLQRFSLTPPAATQVKPCGGNPPGSPVEQNEVIPVALSARTIYVRNRCGTQQLWAASLPSPAELVQCVVPNVRGTTLTSARAAVWAAHCRIGHVGHAYSTHTRAGRVMSQKPKPGKILAKGAQLHLVLSRGKRP